LRNAEHAGEHQAAFEREFEMGLGHRRERHAASRVK
jgi:hypothetical protein